MRVKEIVGLEKLEEDFMPRLKERVMKGSNGPRLTIDIGKEMVQDKVMFRYFTPTGFILFPIVKEPFMMAFSRRQNRKYWFNFMKNESSYECPMGAVVDFQTSFSKRYENRKVYAMLSNKRGPF